MKILRLKTADFVCVKACATSTSKVWPGSTRRVAGISTRRLAGISMLTFPTLTRKHRLQLIISSIRCDFETQNDEFCIQNDEFCIRNDEFPRFCNTNDEFCIQNDECCTHNESHPTISCVGKAGSRRMSGYTILH